MTVSKGGQCRRDKRGWSHGCSGNGGRLFYAGSFVEVAASAGNGAEGR